MSEAIHDRLLQKFIAEGEWGEFAGMVRSFEQWEHYGLFLDALGGFDRAALYQSYIHGEGHIERALLYGALVARDTGASEADVRLLLDMCSYHDVGRINDWLDESHGYRSALRLGELTGRSGEELKLMRAGVEAHSRRDGDLDASLEKYAPVDMDRCRYLALMLKDADGLDRVRISDLDVSFLRFEESRKYKAFSEYLYARYKEELKRMGKLSRRSAPYKDLAVVKEARDHVQDYCYSRGENCAVTLLTGLERLLGTPLPEDARKMAEALCGEEAADARCRLLDGTLLYMRQHFAHLGAEETNRLCREYERMFSEKYRAVICGDIRPVGVDGKSTVSMCAGITMDALLLARWFVREQEPQTAED